jgi:hypothetical protein
VPSRPRLVLAAVTALVVGVAACAVVAAIARALWPSLAGYAHLRLSDYGPLAAAGVLGAAACWPVVVARSATPRKTYLRLAIVVSVVLLGPDLYLLAVGSPLRAVAALVVMHLALAALTYPIMVGLAPATPSLVRRLAPSRVRSAGGAWMWPALAGLVGVVALLGLAALVVVPTDRPEELIPTTGRVVYLLHGALGGVLGVAAGVAVLVARARGDRTARRSSVVGLIGALVAAGGGALDVVPSERLLAVGMMLAGALVAGFAYLAPLGGQEQPDEAVSSRGGDLLSCGRCGGVLPSGGWAPETIGAGGCPLCNGRRLRGAGTVEHCPCCRSGFREVVGGERTWVVTPGRRVGRLSVSPDGADGAPRRADTAVAPRRYR